MTRKKFIKMLMASGYSRNEAAAMAAVAQKIGVPYAEAIGNDAAYQFHKEIEHMQSVIAEVLPCIIQGIVNAMSDVAKVISTYLPAAVEAAKKVFEAYENAEE